ncbi:MAG: hypothetical protein JOZ69_18665, partial [Myxococcales bacterium]|nr:hypothetical protein [Myxococcales bacterium]
MRTTPRTLLGAALLAAGSLQPLSAGAQPPRTDDRRAEADAEFAEAKLLMEAGQTSAACPKFARSQELDPRLGRLLNLAFCHEQEGKVASAWHEYTEATSLAEQRGQAEREDFARARAAAVARELAFVLLELPHDVATAAV